MCVNVYIADTCACVFYICSEFSCESSKPNDELLLEKLSYEVWILTLEVTAGDQMHYLPQRLL